jgi:hypothetical protein
MKNFVFAIILICTVIVSGFAQEKVQITGTNLLIQEMDGFTIDPNTSIIYSDSVGITFIEMPGVSFNSQLESFQNIDEEYAKKGLTLKSKEVGKIGDYNALFLSIESTTAVYQVFLGDDQFCALANVASVEEGGQIDQEKINAYLATLEYQEEENPLEKHANFEFIEVDSTWKFQSFISNMFAFEHTASKDAILALQLPLETLQFNTQEQLAEQFKSKLLASIPGLKVLEEKEKSIGNFSGYHVLLGFEEGKNEHLNLIYMFIFPMERSVMGLQCMGKENNEETIKRFDAFITNLKNKN